MVAGRANASSFALRGVIEGFYGPYYTVSQRQALIRFLGQQDFNLYIYAPKNDCCHRDDWRPYSAAEMAAFAATIVVAGEAGVTFGYALSPSAGLHFSDPAEFSAITTKLEAFYRLGARAFALLLDDITPYVVDQEDARRYGSPAGAQADLCNRVFAWLQELEPACPFFVCPTDYAGRPPFPAALHTLGANLHPAIELFYTGSQICPAEITVADVAAFTAAARRAPVIWDNYPVNDLALAPELHLGPRRGRETTLYAHTHGFVANLMSQPQASQIVLQTIGDYLRAPHEYDPGAAWEQALYMAAGPGNYDALRCFAGNNLASALYPAPPEPLGTLTTAAHASLKLDEQAGTSRAVQALDHDLSTLQASAHHLHGDLGNELMREELLPWLELWEMWSAVGREAIALLPAIGIAPPAANARSLLGELYAAVAIHPCAIGGAVLRPLVDYALQLLAAPSEAPPSSMALAAERELIRT